MDVEALRELLEQRFDGQDKTLERIEKQTTKTNGRVTVLEQRMAIVWSLAAVVTATVAILGFLGRLR